MSLVEQVRIRHDGRFVYHTYKVLPISLKRLRKGGAEYADKQLKYFLS